MTTQTQTGEHIVRPKATPYPNLHAALAALDLDVRPTLEQLGKILTAERLMIEAFGPYEGWRVNDPDGDNKNKNRYLAAHFPGYPPKGNSLYVHINKLSSGKFSHIDFPPEFVTLPGFIISDGGWKSQPI